MVGRIVWGATNGWTRATLGEPDAVLTGVICGIVWAAAWLDTSYLREAYLRGKKTRPYRDPSSDVYRSLPPHRRRYWHSHMESAKTEVGRMTRHSMTKGD